MAFSNIDSLNGGSLLHIVFSNGVRNQISQDFRDWENIKRFKVGNSLARELRFMMQNSFGPARVQYRNPGTSGRSFPAAQQVSLSEKTAKFKEINATIELEYNLWERAMQSPEKYAEPLAIELEAGQTACKRRLAADLYGDGTGVVGTLEADAAAVTSPASSNLVFTLSDEDSDRGHIGFFEYDDILILKDADGTDTALDTSLGTEPVYWKVVNKDRAANTVTLQGLTSAFAAVASISSISVQPADGAVFYRFDQPTGGVSDLDLTASITDYGLVTECIAGLESLSASDGRTVHGITMSGSTGGSRYDANGAIDSRHIQRALSQVKTSVGPDRYKYKMMVQAPETLDALIEARETDRRFNSVEDGARGTKKFVYQHQNDSLECYTSEFCPSKRMYLMPEAKNGEKVLEYHGSDFKAVKPKGGSEWSLKPSADGGFVNTMVSYLQSVGVIICKHPKAIGVIHNFTNT
jgi:hypothetical protein